MVLRDELCALCILNEIMPYLGHLCIINEIMPYLGHLCIPIEMSYLGHLCIRNEIMPYLGHLGVLRRTADNSSQQSGTGSGSYHHLLRDTTGPTSPRVFDKNNSQFTFRPMLNRRYHTDSGILTL
jgi:hypothetical protein